MNCENCGTNCFESGKRREKADCPAWTSKEEMKIRRCCGTWVNCDGNCAVCPTMHTTATNHT